jgi:hypothetical protein
MYSHKCMGSKRLRLRVKAHSTQKRDDSKVITRTGQILQLVTDNGDKSYEGIPVKTKRFTSEDQDDLDHLDWSQVGVWIFDGLDSETDSITVREEDVASKWLLLPGAIVAEYPREWMTHMIK